MREAYAHEAVLAMAPEADLNEPGAAVTAELCGRPDHEPPCPLAAHYVHAERAGGEVRLRILFATEPGNETLVRHRIDDALTRGDGRLRSSRPGVVAPGEADHAERLKRS
jgi:hypothetical protein